MKINYVSYLNPFEYAGGGEVILKRLIEIGRKLGHEIKVSSVYKSLKIDIFKNADLFFLADIYNNPTRFKRFFNKNFIKNIIHNERYIHFDNAYCDVCDLSYLPCNGQIKETNCSYKPKWTFWLSKKCFRNSTRVLYKNSMLNVFLSPLHREIVQKILGKDIVGNYYECKPIIDPKRFYDQKVERDIDNLFVGVICEAKGIKNMKKRFPDGNITMIGKTGNGEDENFGKRLGYIPYKEMPKYFNRANNFIFLPRWPEPQGRVVVEAALCGCNLICNDNVGALSFPFDIKNPTNFSNAEEEFWEIVEKIQLKDIKENT